MSFKDDLIRLAPNEPNLESVLDARIDAMACLGVLSFMSNDDRRLGTIAVELNYYIATLEATLINWLNLQATEEMKHDLSSE